MMSISSKFYMAEIWGSLHFLLTSVSCKILEENWVKRTEIFAERCKILGVRSQWKKGPIKKFKIKRNYYAYEEGCSFLILNNTFPKYWQIEYQSKLRQLVFFSIKTRVNQRGSFINKKKKHISHKFVFLQLINGFRFFSLVIPVIFFSFCGTIWKKMTTNYTLLS
jgi:hypothetical protein